MTMKLFTLHTDNHATALMMLLITFVLALLASPVNAADDATGFDHFSTGFPLTGKHQFIDCSSCHVAGQFKGTPIDCGQCHDNSRAPGKHAQHIISGNFCDDCHTVDTWRGARFDHSSVVGSCDSCHNGNIAPGKSPAHILSTPICDDCHNTISFTRVGHVDHGAVIGTCKSCHNGFTATGMPVGHPLTNDECDACHDTRTWRAVRFDHSNVTGQCSSCHNGGTATGKSPTHLQTTGECDLCHNTTTWLGASFDHNSVTGQCTSCHNGSTATGKTTTHFVTSLDCERCHNTTRWTPQELFRHDSPDYPGDHRTATLCVDCHTTNNQAIVWPFTAYRPDCAGCHADVYNRGEIPDKHKNTPIIELTDCAGSCHFDGTKSGEHRPSSAEW